MTEHTTESPTVSNDPGQAIQPVRVSAEEYMERYAHDFYEWADGELEPMSPVTVRHNILLKYLLILLDAYFSLQPIGRTQYQPFVMRLDAAKAYREPDIQVILHANPGQFTSTAMIGPADIVIEIVLPESVERDYGKKFLEYEKSGVREYWLIDPLREEARFHRLGEQGVYKSFPIAADGNCESPLLPGLKIHVPTLWQQELPNLFQTAEAVKAMLASSAGNS